MFFKIIFVAVSMYWQRFSVMFYSLLENLHMNIICLYYAYILVELGFKMNLIWSQFAYFKPYRWILNLGFIIFKLFLKFYVNVS